MNKRHKWADVIIAYAEGKEVQFWNKDWESRQEWMDSYNLDGIDHDHLKWRIKPRMIKIGDMEVPEPLKTPPADGVSYFTVSVETGGLCFKNESVGEEHSNEWFDRGLCHLTREAAIAHAKALIKISGGTV